MSKTKEKKVVGIPTVPLTQRGYRTVDAMDNVYGRSGGVGGIVNPNDPLAQMEAEETREALQELRDLKMKKKQVELRQKIEREKEALGNIDVAGGGLNIKGMYNFTPMDIQQISKMPEADQQAFYSTLQNIQMMAAMTPRGSGGQAMTNPILYMMATGGLGRQGQGLGLKDVIELQKNWDTISRGAGKGNQELTNTLLLKLMTETVPGLQTQAAQNMQMGYNAIIQHLSQNQADPLRDLRFLKEGATALGYTPQNVSNDVAKMRIEMEDRWKMKDFEQRQRELDYRRNMGIIQQILDSVQNVTKNVSRDHIRTLFQPKQPQPQPVIQPQQVVQPTADTGLQPYASHKAPMTNAPPAGKVQIVQYPCSKCGAAMYAPLGEPRVTCAQCGQVHQTQG